MCGCGCIFGFVHSCEFCSEGVRARLDGIKRESRVPSSESGFGFGVSRSVNPDEQATKRELRGRDHAMSRQKVR